MIRSLRADCFVVAVMAITVTGCLPYPLQSPRVEPGITVGTAVGIRALARDTVLADGTRLGTVPFPEFSGSAAVGFAHADGTGPAFRFGGTLGFPGPLEFDAYGQLPRVGPLIVGAGALLTPYRLVTTNGGRIPGPSPYAAAGWQVNDQTMVYASLAGLWIHQTTSSGPNTAESVVATRVLVIGFQHRRELADNEGSTAWRAFVAMFHGNNGVESEPTFGGPGSPRSLFVAGVSLETTRPFGWAGVPRRRRRPY